MIDSPEAACAHGADQKFSEKQDDSMSWLPKDVSSPPSDASGIEGSKLRHEWERSIDDASRMYKLPLEGVDIFDQP